MEFLKAFPIAIIDEDYEGKHAAGRGMRQLAEAIEKEGFRIVAGVSYADAQRLVEIFNSEFVLARLCRRHRGRSETVAGPGGGAGRKATPQ